MGKVFDALTKAGKGLKPKNEIKDSFDNKRISSSGHHNESIVPQQIESLNNPVQEEVKDNKVGIPLDISKTRNTINTELYSKKRGTATLHELRKKHKSVPVDHKINIKGKRFFTKKRKKDLFTYFKPSSIISEQFKVIRTMLLRKMKEEKLKTIMITSTLPGEGKSFVASNLAVSIAKGFDEYVLLVDADLKKPAVYQIFDLKPEPGLSDFILDDKQELCNLIQKTDVEKLSILTSGFCPENSSELISSEIMKAFVKEVKYRYDDRYIIFDTPPAQIAEALTLADIVDGVVLVVKSADTQKEMIKKIAETIGKEKIIGVILNYCDMSPKRYYKYYQ